jgi:hypothetical protein
MSPAARPVPCAGLVFRFDAKAPLSPHHVVKNAREKEPGGHEIPARPTGPGHTGRGRQVVEAIEGACELGPPEHSSAIDDRNDLEVAPRWTQRIGPSVRRAMGTNLHSHARLSRVSTLLAALASREVSFRGALALPVKVMSTTQCPVLT